MRKLLLVIMLLTGCSARVKLPEVEIVENTLVRIPIRVAYQKDLEHKLETRVHIAEAFASLEKELHVRFDVQAEAEFDPGFEPEGLLTDWQVQMKAIGCGELNPPDGTPILCVYEGKVLVADEESGGAVLGVQWGATVSVGNMKDRELFMNVLRHEMGHLLGADHSKDLMGAVLPKEGMERLLPFPKEAVDEIKAGFNDRFKDRKNNSLIK